MGFCYLDSSAMLKVFKKESESDAMIDYYSKHLDQLVTSELTITEVLGNLIRFDIPTHVAERAFSGLTLMPVKQEILRKAAELMGQGLRSLDAIHLATALSLKGHLSEIVTYDHQFAEVGTAQGVAVKSPS